MDGEMQGQTSKTAASSKHKHHFTAGHTFNQAALHCKVTGTQVRHPGSRH
jgi:hypothetical protein